MAKGLSLSYSYPASVTYVRIKATGRSFAVVVRSKPPHRGRRGGTRENRRRFSVRLRSPLLDRATSIPALFVVRPRPEKRHPPTRSSERRTNHEKTNERLTMLPLSLLVSISRRTSLPRHPLAPFLPISPELMPNYAHSESSVKRVSESFQNSEYRRKTSSRY